MQLSHLHELRRSQVIPRVVRCARGAAFPRLCHTQPRGRAAPIVLCAQLSEEHVGAVRVGRGGWILKTPPPPHQHQKMQPDRILFTASAARTSLCCAQKGLKKVILKFKLFAKIRDRRLFQCLILVPTFSFQTNLAFFVAT